MRPLWFVLLVACGPGSEPHDDLIDGAAPGFPDPALQIPPACVPGACATFALPLAPFSWALDRDGGVWFAFLVPATGDAFHLGDFTVPWDNNIFQDDNFLAHLDASGTWDLVEGLGFGRVDRFALGPDGELALAGTFFPSITLDGVTTGTSATHTGGWLQVREGDGAPRWGQAWAYTDVPVEGFQPVAIAWGPEGDLWVAGGLTGTRTIGGVDLDDGEDSSRVVQLAAGDGALVKDTKLGGSGLYALMFGEDGGTFVLSKGFRALGADVQSPNWAVARYDEGNTWVTGTSSEFAASISAKWARLANGDFLLGFGWDTGEHGTMAGTMSFGEIGPIPMAMFQDGTNAVLSADGAWLRGVESPPVTALASSGDGPAYGLSGGFCEWIAGGVLVGCRGDRVVDVQVAPDGALWRLTSATDVYGATFELERIPR